MPSRRVGFRDKAVIIKMARNHGRFKGEKIDLSRECLVGANILNQSESLSGKTNIT